jgi:hypothetical protein
MISCKNGNKNLNEDPSDKNIRKHAIGVAEIYVKGRLKNAKKTVSKDGLIVLSANESKWLIDPSKIVTGEIDEDANTDAVVPVHFFRSQSLVMTEHLILINRDGNYVIAKALDSEMKILAIKDRMIFAEISKVASDAPNFGCAICKEVVKYKFVGDSLSRVK